jgi:hypothetical protein
MRDMFQPGSGRRLAWGLFLAAFLAASGHVVMAIAYSPVNVCASSPDWFWRFVYGCW